MSALEYPLYRFGDFELDPLERRLLRAGQPVALTPKVFETLVLLVTQAGHAVSKDELMKALWPRGYVEESNLTKHVWLIRRALGDGEDDSRFIETVPKLGYRFVAPVTVSPRAPAPVGVADGSRRWRWGAAGAAAALLLMAAGGAAWWLRRASPAPELHHSGHTIAFVGFTNLSRNPKDAWLGPALTEMLGAEVSIADNVQVVPDESVRDASADLAAPVAGGYAPATLARLRHRLDADYVVSGGYLVGGSAANAPLRLDIAMQDTHTGRRLAEVTREAGIDGLIAVTAAAGATLREKLGVTPAAGALSLVANQQPPNVEVARRMGFALDALKHYDAARARDEVLGAIAAAPGYAPAYTLLAQAWTALGYRDKALAAAEQAAAHAGSLPPEERLLTVAVLETARTQWAAAADAWRELARLKPGDVEYRVRLIDTQIALGATSDAAATLRDLAHIPGAADDPRVELAAARLAAARKDAQGNARHAGRALELAGRRDEAAMVALTQLQLAGARMYLHQNQAARGELASAIATFHALGNPRGEATARGTLGGVLANLDLLPQAREEYQRALTLYMGIGDAAGIGAVYRDLCIMLWNAGDRDGAQAAAKRVLEQGRETSDRGLEGWGRLALANIAADEGASDDVVAQYRAVIALSEQAGGDTWTLATLADTERLRGELTAARTDCERAYAGAERLSDPQFAIYSGFNCALIMVDQGRESEARAALERVIRRVGTGGDNTYKNNSLTTLAQLDMDAGHWQVAADKLHAAAQGFAAAEESTGEADAQALLALCEQALGDAPARETAANRARTLRRSITSRQEVYVVDIALARLDGRASPEDAARRLLATAVDAQRRHWLAWALEARLAAWQLLAMRHSPGADTLRADIAQVAGQYGFGRVLQLLGRHRGPPNT
ncbi:MAG: winged helix-turn-helix domain-containing protein [Proteobacteria bacterium]|nr:winged helix-turn-helix domain-containing protein [Pseudomonadota bacterium]